MPVEDKQENRLSRWSKRKLAVAEEARAEEVDVSDVSDVSEDELLEREVELTENREAAEAVDLEALTEESDFSVFMKEGVPDLLKRKALAALWRTNPIFANVDGLVDYDDDFGSPDLIMKTFKSAYQAGRGYLEHVERLAKVEAGEIDQAEVPLASVSEAEVSEDIDSEEDEPVDVVGDDVETAHATDEYSAILIEEEIPEDQPQPRVSLRKRLQLEEEA